MNYVTIIATPIYDQNRKPVANWPAGKPFVTGGYVKDGMLYLGTYGVNVNRWLPIGTYKLTDVVVPPPPVDPPPPTLPVGAIEQRRYSLDEGRTWSEWEYWKKYDY